MVSMMARLRKSSLSESVEQAVVHLFAQLGDELKPLGHEQLLG